MIIRSIIFDFGGVILDIDPKLTIKAFEELGVKELDVLEKPTFYEKIIFPLEKGTINESVFRNKIRNYVKLNLSDKQIDDAWNALLLTYKPERIHLLEKIKKHYPIFLLSNSNIIHYHYFLKELTRQFGYTSFDQLFNKAYFSFLMNKIKPEKEIYETVIKAEQLKPENTLFIDDRKENIMGAKECGLQTHFLKKTEDICDLFDQDGRLTESI